MSRKDPRCRIVIPLSQDQRAALRGMARAGGRRRSLGDRLRWIVAVELAAGLSAPEAAGEAGILAEARATGAGLPLQLPNALRREVHGLAQQWQCSPVLVIQRALEVHLQRRA